MNAIADSRGPSPVGIEGPLGRPGTGGGLCPGRGRETGDWHPRGRIIIINPCRGWPLARGMILDGAENVLNAPETPVSTR